MSRPPEILRAASPLSAKPNRNNRAGSVLYISADDGAYTFAYLPAFNGAAADNQYQSVKICRKAAASVDRNGAEFVADISHDLKTPISIIMANNSILKSNKDSSVADNMQWIESTDRASDDMMQLIGNTLTLSSVDSQPQPYSTSEKGERGNKPYPPEFWFSL